MLLIRWWFNVRFSVCPSGVICTTPYILCSCSHAALISFHLFTAISLLLSFSVVVVLLLVLLLLLVLANYGLLSSLLWFSVTTHIYTAHHRPAVCAHMGTCGRMLRSPYPICDSRNNWTRTCTYPPLMDHWLNNEQREVRVAVGAGWLWYRRCYIGHRQRRREKEGD